MDKTLTKRSRDRSGPIVVLANWFQFSATGETIQPSVESRMLLWCEKGSGRLEVNGVARDFQPGDWTFLPWKHRIHYQPDTEDPFLIGGVHVIPDHAIRAPVIFQVAHHARDPLAHSLHRRDAEWAGLKGAIRGHFGEADRLHLLATYIIEKFQSAAPEPGAMRDLARLLVGELQLAVKPRPSPVRPVPGVLRRVQDYIRTHLNEKITVEDLALLSASSVAKLHRLFHDHTRMSPGRFVAQSRAERAALLLRTTTLSVREIGLQIGLPDPFHFSRFFKRKMGLSPRAYQQSRRFF